MTRNKTELLHSDDNSHTYVEKQLGLQKNKNVNEIQAAKLKVLSVKVHSRSEKIKDKGMWKELVLCTFKEYE
jgi:hypothetical protein